ncbi:MAG: VWA domain-containing protein [Acidobacteriota bacterium]
MTFLRFIFCVVLISSAAVLCLAQEDPPLTVDSSIVRMNVGVVDQRGHPITTLDKNSFSIYEDGVKQQILGFKPSTAPFSVVMLLDMSGSTLPFRQTIRLSAARFLDALSPDDRVAVIEFYDKINLRNDFTTNRRTTLQSIEVANGRGKTQLYKALDMALDRLGTETGRRKAIIVLTDGVDTASQDKDREALSSVKDDLIKTALKPEDNDLMKKVLLRSDQQGVTIYPLALPTGDPAKLADPTPRQVAMFQAARDRLQIVADRTGGVVSKINRLEDMGTLYAQVAADLRTLYTIEYQPTNDKHDGKWRAIKIETADSNLIPRTRQGYFAR